MLKAIQKIVSPKLVSEDSRILNSILTNQLPGVLVSKGDYSDVERSIKKSAEILDLDPSEYLVGKGVKLKNTSETGQGVIVIG